MICKFCGKEVKDGERICKYCGTVLTSGAEQSKIEYTKEREAGLSGGDKRIYRERTDTAADLGETQVFTRPNVPGGFENSRRVQDEVNRRHHNTPPKRNYYRYNPSEEAKRLQSGKLKKNGRAQKLPKVKPVRKNRHIGRTIAGLIFKAVLGFIIGFLLYVLAVKASGWISGAFENADIPLLDIFQ